MADLGYQHGLGGSACPTRISNPEYYAGFVAGWSIWAAANQVGDR